MPEDTTIDISIVTLFSVNRHYISLTLLVSSVSESGVYQIYIPYTKRVQIEMSWIFCWDLSWIFCWHLSWIFCWHLSWIFKCKIVMFKFNLKKYIKNTKITIKFIQKNIKIKVISNDIHKNHKNLLFYIQYVNNLHATFWNWVHLHGHQYLMSIDTNISIHSAV